MLNKYNLCAMKRRKIGYKTSCWVACDKDIMQYVFVGFMGKYRSKQDCLQSIEQHKKLMQRILNKI